MEIRVSATGKKLVSREQKKAILRELSSGVTGPELSTKYGIPIQSIYKWNRNPELMANRSLAANSEDTVSRRISKGSGRD